MRRSVVVAIVAALAAVWLTIAAAASVKAAGPIELGVGAGATGAAPAAGPVTAVGKLRRPIARRPAPRPIPAAIAARGPSTAGKASWYCSAARHSPCTVGHPGGLYAAAGPAVRAMFGGRYMGRQVTVSSGGAWVRVTIIDWCGCPDGRVIDLYADAFDDLADLGRGTLDVVVRP